MIRQVFDYIPHLTHPCLLIYTDFLNPSLSLEALAQIFNVYYFDWSNLGDCVKKELNSLTALITLYSLCCSMIYISLNALIGVSIIIKVDDQINTLQDLLHKDGKLVPSIYKGSSMEGILVRMLSYHDNLIIC